MKNPKANAILMFLLLFLFGIGVGIHLDSDIRMTSEDLIFPMYRDMEVQEMTDLRRANEGMKTRIQELRELVEFYEVEMAKENITLQKLRNDVAQFKLMAGHQTAEGAGVIITLEGIYGDYNIALIVAQKGYLISLINDLKYAGAEVISINEQRLTGRSEVTIAGSHININGHAIAPPYHIKAIGEQRAFSAYIERGTFIFENMNSYGIRTNIQFLDDIRIPAIEREKPIQFLKTTEETI